MRRRCAATGNIGTTLGAGTVDARFWALVCDDEEWLRTEFDRIVSAPAELLITAPPVSVVATDPAGPGAARGAAASGRRGRGGPGRGTDRGGTGSGPLRARA